MSLGGVKILWDHKTFLQTTSTMNHVSELISERSAISVDKSTSFCEAVFHEHFQALKLGLPNHVGFESA